MNTTSAGSVDFISAGHSVLLDIVLRETPAEDEEDEEDDEEEQDDEQDDEDQDEDDSGGYSE